MFHAIADIGIEIHPDVLKGGTEKLLSNLRARIFNLL